MMRRYIMELQWTLWPSSMQTSTLHHQSSQGPRRAQIPTLINVTGLCLWFLWVPGSQMKFLDESVILFEVTNDKKVSSYFRL